MIAWILCGVLALMLLATLVATYNLIQHSLDQLDDEKAEHEACHEATLKVLETASKRTDAVALEAAADAWDSIEEQQERIRIANTTYREGGPSVPTLWLRERALKQFGDSA